MQGNDVSTSQIMSEAPYFTGTHAISPADLKTAAFDARFPYTNQSKNCWQNYVDFYRCQKKLVSAASGTWKCMQTVCHRAKVRRRASSSSRPSTRCAPTNGCVCALLQTECKHLFGLMTIRMQVSKWDEQRQAGVFPYKGGL